VKKRVDTSVYVECLSAFRPRVGITLPPDNTGFQSGCTRRVFFLIVFRSLFFAFAEIKQIICFLTPFGTTPNGEESLHVTYIPPTTREVGRFCGRCSCRGMLVVRSWTARGIIPSGAFALHVAYIVIFGILYSLFFSSCLSFLLYGLKSLQSLVVIMGNAQLRLSSS
jgi:hypothetical protein